MATERTDNDAKKAGGYLKEKFTVAMTRITDDEVVRAIAKVSSHKLKLPNEKHMLRLLQASFGHFNAGKHIYDNVNEFVITELEKRTHAHDWIPVLKTFLVLHRFMHDGSSHINDMMQKHRRIFCGNYLKDLADSPDGAVQQRVIRQYSRYLEERMFAEHNIGYGRIESDDFTQRLDVNRDFAAVIAVAESLLLQLNALIDVEYADATVSNEATLKVFENLVQDGKRLYVLLTDRVKFILDIFDASYSQPERKKCFEVYKKYHQTIGRLADYFGRMRNGNIHFGLPIPELTPLPEAMLEHMELSLLETKRPPPASPASPAAGSPAGSSAPAAGQLAATPSPSPAPSPPKGAAPLPAESTSTQPPTQTSRSLTRGESVPVGAEPPLRRGGNRMSDLFDPQPVSAPSTQPAPPTLDLFAAAEMSNRSTPSATPTQQQPPSSQYPPPRTPPPAQPTPTASQPSTVTNSHDLFAAPIPQPVRAAPAPAGGFDPFADAAPAPLTPPLHASQASGTPANAGVLDFFAAPATAQQPRGKPSSSSQQAPSAFDPNPSKPRAW